MPVKLGSALYKFRKAQGLAEVPKATPVKSPKTGGKPRVKSPANWSHEVHGDYLNITATDLASMFPQLNLDQSNLSRVKNGQQKSHKGWTVINLSTSDAHPPLATSVTSIVKYSHDLIERGA